MASIKVKLSVEDGMELQKYSSYIDGYVEGAFGLAQHLKMVKAREFEQKALAKSAEPPKQQPEPIPEMASGDIAAATEPAGTS